MKKQILSIAFMAGIVGLMATGCSSNKAASGSSDSTKKDSMATMSKPDTTVKPDTAKHDTTKTPPKM